MSHPPRTEWMQLLDGEVTANREAAMRAHAAACADCERELGRLRALVGDLRRPIDTGGDGAIDAVMARIATAPPDKAVGVPGPARPRWRWLAAGGGILAAAAAVVIIVATGGGPPDEMGEFVARGRAHDRSPLEKLVGFDFYAGTTLLTEDSWFERGTPLSAHYHNLSDEPVYVLVFAYASGEVFWLYPAYVDPDTDPVAVRLAPQTRDRPFGESIVVDDILAVGTLVLVAVVTREPMTVRAIESLEGGERLPVRLAERWPDAAVHSLSVRMLP